MLLTADDVRNEKFALATLTRKGYDEGDVDDFLDRVVGAIESRDATIAGLQRNHAALAQELALVHQTSQAGTTAAPPPASPEPNAATDLLALAQKTALEHVAAARTEAAEIVADAEREARRTHADAQEEVRRSVKELENQRREIVVARRREQQELDEARAALRASGEQARTQLEAYLTGVLERVRLPRSSNEGGELKALSA